MCGPLPWLGRPSGVAFARAAESGHATACPYKSYKCFRIADRDNLISSDTRSKRLTSSRLYPGQPIFRD